jgi:alpha-amylase/alpha-mannosidase (GH57 family)
MEHISFLSRGIFPIDFFRKKTISEDFHFSTLGLEEVCMVLERMYRHSIRRRDCQYTLFLLLLIALEYENHHHHRLVQCEY